MAEVIDGILIREVETKNIMTKSSLPVGGYSVNPYVGCTHACKYCYASFMKRFTGHTEEWGTFLDVKHWPEIKNPKKYAGQRVVIGSVTDGYNPQEEQFGNTRKLLEQLIGSDADILICTKSDLVVRDIDLLKKLGRVTVSWSINTLDENFKNDSVIFFICAFSFRFGSTNNYHTTSDKSTERSGTQERKGGGPRGEANRPLIPCLPLSYRGRCSAPCSAAGHRGQSRSGMRCNLQERDYSAGSTGNAPSPRCSRSSAHSRRQSFRRGHSRIAPWQSGFSAHSPVACPRPAGVPP